MDSYREITETLERTLGEIRELLDNAGNPQHLIKVLEEVLLSIASDKSATLAIEAKQRKFEERQGELSRWEERLAAREEKVKLSESWLSENICGLTSGMQSLEITKSSARQDAEQLQGLISSNEAIRSKLQADQQETTRLQNEREAALNQREANLDSRKDTMDAYLTSRGRELQQLQMTLLDNATTQQKLHQDGESTRRAHWSELIQQQTAFDEYKDRYKGIRSLAVKLVAAMNEVTDRLNEDRLILNDRRIEFDAFRAEVVAVSEEVADIGRDLRAAKNGYTELTRVLESHEPLHIPDSRIDHGEQYEMFGESVQISDSLTDHGGRFELYGEEPDDGQLSSTSATGKRTYQRSPTDTSPEKDTATKKPRSDAGTGSPENFRRRSLVFRRHGGGSPVLRRPGGGSLRSPSKLPMPQSRLGQQSQSAAGPSTGPPSNMATTHGEGGLANVEALSIPERLQGTWDKVILDTGIEASAVQQLVG
ncbi:MAG: hypothetical protein Q9224_006516, partial [Gallowayella concinna]